jgi:hypothetical protein
MVKFSRRSVAACQQRRGSPTGTGMMCDRDDIIGIATVARPPTISTRSAPSVSTVLAAPVSSSGTGCRSRRLQLAGTVCQVALHCAT